MTEAIGHDSYLIDTGLYGPLHAACYLIADQGELAIIDTGTQHSLPRVLDAIAAAGATPEQVRYVMPTHVHLDHAGGTGALMQACPNATLIVHPKGLPHMLDPSKLQAGATAVYGEAAFQRDFGELLPVAEQRTHAAADLEDQKFGRWFLDPVSGRGYPRDAVADYGWDMAVVKSGDLEVIAAQLDPHAGWRRLGRHHEVEPREIHHLLDRPAEALERLRSDLHRRTAVVRHGALATTAAAAVGA